MIWSLNSFLLFFFCLNAPTSEIYTLSLHDALPIWSSLFWSTPRPRNVCLAAEDPGKNIGDRKSTRLNSSHMSISYAVFCLKKKMKYMVVKQVFLKEKDAQCTFLIRRNTFYTDLISL